MSYRILSIVIAAAVSVVAFVIAWLLHGVAHFDVSPLTAMGLTFAAFVLFLNQPVSARK